MLTIKNFNKEFKTFTISWEEKSDMSSGWTYSDDAYGLTPGNGVFDDFFGYSAVLLDNNGNETAEMTQSGGIFTGAMTSLGNITNGNNVMIKFPTRGIKMSKSGSIVTLSITNGLGREDEGFQYYAHCTGTLSNPGTPKNAFYLGAYEAYNNSGVLKSWSGQSPTGGVSQKNFCSYAKANGDGYNIKGFYQTYYIAALYIMKYGNPDCQNTIGRGYVSGSAAPNTGGTNSQTNATYGDTSAFLTQMKIFGLEDWRGGIEEWIGGAYVDSNKLLYTGLSGWNGGGHGVDSTGTYLSSGSYFDLSSIAGNNKAMFAPLATVNDGNYSTYYCDMAGVYGGNPVYVSGHWNSTGLCGVFTFNSSRDADNGYAFIGSRIMYL